MKVKILNRNVEDYTRERSNDVHKVHRNLDPHLHQFDKAHEYTRALNAAKLDRVFSKPFVTSFEHSDGVTCLAKNARRLNCLLSGAADGEIKLWDVAARRCLRRLKGHTSAVRGVTVAPDGETCVSVSDDCSIRLWKIPFAPFESGSVCEDVACALEFSGKQGFRAVDHHRTSARFVTAAATVELWDHAHAEPLQSFTWGADSIVSVRFNPAEQDVFATTGSDRGIALYDLRMATPIRKLIMTTRANALAWNPMEAFNFTTANEDACLHTYDMRKLQRALCVHKDFVSAVMDVDYSPTGREFVAGSYDRSVRLFDYNGGHSKELYHAKRMQRVFAVQFSMDGSYVFSGSDDMNVRVWKAQASAPLGTLLPREQHALAYNQALVKRYEHLPEVRKISKHRILPAPIHKATKLRAQAEETDRRKLKNRVAHSAPGSVTIKPARKKKIIAEVE